MSLEEKKEFLAEVFELEEEEVVETVILNDLETWDSVAILSIIAFMGEKFNKYPLAKEISKFKTMGDIIDMMNESE